jgi:hypothetical protein
MITDNYIEILEKYVSIDWNNKTMYEKMLKEIFREYEKDISQD